MNNDSIDNEKLDNPDDSNQNIERSNNNEPPFDTTECISIQERMSSLQNTYVDIVGNALRKMVMPKLTDVISRMVSTFAEYTKTLLAEYCKIDFSYLFSGLKNTIKAYEKVLHECIFDAKWFPYVFQYIKKDYGVEFAAILDNTGYNTKRRTKEIDALIFRILNKTLIEKIRKSWRDYGIPPYKLRILNQAVYAYHRKEYAVTAITLSTMWQGIIADKTISGNKGYQTDKKTKEQFSRIININDFPEIYDEFFAQYIMYECRSIDDIKEDVPGRHSFAHSWFNKYPTRKTALNAILFTDFLIKADAVIDETSDDNKDCTS